MPFPKSHTYESASLEMFSKLAAKGSQPSKASALNSATGWGRTYTVSVCESTQPKAETPVKVMEVPIRPPLVFSNTMLGACSSEVLPPPKFQVNEFTPSIIGMVNSNGEHAVSLGRSNVKSASGYT